MTISFIDIPFTSVQLYQKPINMRFGERKLTEICRTQLKRDPEIDELFLFYNSRRDALKLFWRDASGSQEVSKAMTRGGFLLPAPQAGETFVKLDRGKLKALFRS